MHKGFELLKVGFGAEVHAALLLVEPEDEDRSPAGVAVEIPFGLPLPPFAFAVNVGVIVAGELHQVGRVATEQTAERFQIERLLDQLDELFVRINVDPSAVLLVVVHGIRLVLAEAFSMMLRINDAQGNP